MCVWCETDNSRSRKYGINNINIQCSLRQVENNDIEVRGRGFKKKGGG